MTAVSAGSSWSSVSVARSLAVVALVCLVPHPAIAQAPTEVRPPTVPFEISDNSFLVEEALNQEPGIFQNIVNYRWYSGGDWEATFTQEWPVVSRTHQLSYTVPFASRDGLSGFADLVVHYRLQLFDGAGAWPAFSPRVSLIVPSGSASRGLGNGEAGWEINLPFSKQVKDVYFHWNAGFTHFPVVRVDEEEYELLTPRLAGSAIWRVRPMLNLMMESVVAWEAQAVGNGLTSGKKVVTLLPGFRTGWNAGDAQTIVGFGVPVLIFDGDSSAGVFLYLSYELPFMKP